MSEHTPGPWRVVGLDVQACDARRTIVAQVTGALSNPTANGDRRLIAAAPDLLVALQAMASFNVITGLSAHIAHEASRAGIADPLALARSVIAKARGTGAPASEPRSGEAS